MCCRSKPALTRGALDVACQVLPREMDACLTRCQVSEFSRRSLELEHGALRCLGRMIAVVQAPVGRRAE